MRFSILAVEFSMRRPDERLGDPVFSDLLSRPVSSVPVLHVFGRTTGAVRQSTCVHVHHVLPYFFVPRYDASVTAVQFASQLEAVAVHRLRLQPSSRVIHHVAIVEATPFYGYYEHAKEFFKVFVYVPSMVAKLANLLGSTTHVGGRRWQPYEAHLPYHFQFMVDYGLTGMGVLAPEACIVRRPLPTPPLSEQQAEPMSRYHPASTGCTAHDATPWWSTLYEAGASVPDGVTIAPLSWDLERIAPACDVEIDIVPSSLPPCTVPGSSMRSVKRSLREYLVDHGLDLGLLEAAIAPAPGRYGTLTMVQQADPMRPWMVRLLKKYTQMQLSQRIPGAAAALVDDASCYAAAALTADSSGSLVRHDVTRDESIRRQLPQATTALHILTTAYKVMTPAGRLSAFAGANPTDEPVVDREASWAYESEEQTIGACPTFHLLDGLCEDDIDDGDDAAVVSMIDTADDRRSPSPQSDGSSQNSRRAPACESTGYCESRHASLTAVVHEADEEPELLGEELAAASPTPKSLTDCRAFPKGTVLFFDEKRAVRLTSRTAGCDPVHSFALLPSRSIATSDSDDVQVVWLVTASELPPLSNDVCSLRKHNRLKPNELFVTDCSDMIPCAVLRDAEEIVVASPASHTETRLGGGGSGMGSHTVVPHFVCRYRYHAHMQRFIVLDGDDAGVVCCVPTAWSDGAAGSLAMDDDDDDGDVSRPPDSTIRWNDKAFAEATQAANNDGRIVRIEDVSGFHSAALAVSQGLPEALEGPLHRSVSKRFQIIVATQHQHETLVLERHRNALETQLCEGVSGQSGALDGVQSRSADSDSAVRNCSAPSGVMEDTALRKRMREGDTSTPTPPIRTSCKTPHHLDTPPPHVPDHCCITVAVSRCCPIAFAAVPDIRDRTVSLHCVAVAPKVSEGCPAASAALFASKLAVEGRDGTSGSAGQVASLSRPSIGLLTTVTPRFGANQDSRAAGMQRPARVRRRRPTTAPPRHSAVSASGCAAAAPSRLPYVSVVSIEILADAPLDKCSDPKSHAIRAVALASTSTAHDTFRVSFVMVTSMKQHLAAACTDCDAVQLHLVQSEEALIRCVMSLVQREDPDVVMSWDPVRAGLGFFAERARRVARIDALAELGRLKVEALPTMHGRISTKLEDMRGVKMEDSDESLNDYNEELDDDRRSRFASNTNAVNPYPLRHPTLRISGRVVLNLGKACRSELKQTSYTMQAVHKSLFGTPLPLYSDGYVARAFFTGFAEAGVPLAASSTERFACARLACQVLRDRAIVPLRIARHLDVFVRTSELAQLYGILFSEVLSRGSQFRVESFLLRYAKPRGFLTVSPSREQVMLQNRQEGIALVMEPYSGFYKDPVLVLDFRSLYPSMIIAYNLCYSTCLGKVSKNAFIKLGAVAGYRTPVGTLQRLVSNTSETDDETDVTNDSCSVTFSPTSCMYTPSSLRTGILPEMLEEILNTRFQVQAVMKAAAAAGDDATKRVLDAQQLGLKLLANVTYGYAAATFTGRMPCSDVADSIVLLGRQTLERAIRMIEGNAKWRAKVVYGDTDSLFVHLPGRTRLEAFEMGEEMAREVTNANPHPVTLKFEKVYHPSLMVTKKRYVGYSWDKRDQREPTFDAKGIETVRRDQCAATSRIMEMMLRALLDDEGRIARAKSIFEEQALKLASHDINPIDVILRREVKLGTYARDSTLPPAARVALQKIQTDAASAPLQGERVPYLVVTGNSGAAAGSTKLMDLVTDPTRVLRREIPFSVHAEHYMVKHIVPSLARVLHLVGIDVDQWYRALPKRTVSASWLFSIKQVQWDVEGLAEAREDEQLSSLHPIPRMLRSSTGHADSRVTQTMLNYAPAVRCAACLASQSCTKSTLPPVCRQCFTDRGAALWRTQQRLCDVERELRRLDRGCEQCAWARPETVDMEALMSGLPQPATLVPRSLRDSWASSCGGTAPRSGACISLDCGISFQIARLRDIRVQLIILADFLCRADGDVSRYTPLSSERSSGDVGRGSGLRGHWAHTSAKRLGGRDRPVDVDD